MDAAAYMRHTSSIIITQGSHKHSPSSRLAFLATTKAALPVRAYQPPQKQPTTNHTYIAVATAATRAAATPRLPPHMTYGVGYCTMI